MGIWNRRARREREPVESLEEQERNPELLAAEAEANAQPSDPPSSYDNSN